MEKEHKEVQAEQICEKIGQVLIEQLNVDEPLSIKAATLNAALAYVKHNGVSDNPQREGSPVKSVEAALRRPLPPFSSVDEELKP